MSRLTKEYFDKKLDEQTNTLTEQNQELARMTKRGFDSVDVLLKDIRQELDVRKDVEQLKLDMQEIRHALAIDKSEQ